MLKFAKSLGDMLIVGLNSDDSVRSLKGKSRPINSQEHRLSMLRELRSVDDAVIFDEATPCRLIEEIRPDIFVLGSEYRGRAIAEHHSAERCGCQVAYYDKNTNISTTEIIGKLTGKG
jgi:D-beta-D-heptose 7-phosphate kinase/D-beta-D-heptose 1-phosphate adenosyltransferase